MKFTPLILLAPVLVTLGAVFGYYAKQPTPVDPALAITPSGVAARQNLVSAIKAPPETDRMVRLETELRQLSEKVALLESQQTAKNDETPAPNNSQNGVLFSREANETASLADNLVKAGLEPWRAEDIARRQSQQALARLELRDKAARENYLRTSRFSEEMRDLEADTPSVRDEIGIDTYDNYLYQSGQNNRVAVASIMTGSAAEQAGMRDGDLILSYDNQRLFSYGQLRDLTTEGERGETVNVTVSRSGSEMSLALPRGPLGVGLDVASVDPQG